MLTRAVMPYALAVGSLSVFPASSAAAQENPSTPGSIPNPGTYQGSVELQRQSDEQDRQQREQQQQQQYSSPQRSAPESSGVDQQGGGSARRAAPRVPINFAADNRAMTAIRNHQFATALAILRPLGARGDLLAEYLLGAIYDNGKGVPENHPMALQWYQRSVAGGFSMSMRNLGTMYRNGEATGRPDYVQAYRWYSLAMAHFVPGEADANSIQELNQDLSEVSAKMTAAQIVSAKRLARETNLPFLQ